MRHQRFPNGGQAFRQDGTGGGFENFILMHALGANTAGQLGSVIAGGLLLALVRGLGWG
jgi:oxaloacetate decarboxylase beta subunit